MSLKIVVTARCIDGDTNLLYSCDAIYCPEDKTITPVPLIQSEVDDCQKQYLLKMASDALYVTHTLVKNQIEVEPSDK